MKRIILACIVAAFSCLAVFAQDKIVAGDRIKPKFNATLTRYAAEFLFKYTVSNSPDAEQEIYRFLIVPPSVITVNDLRAPENWYIGVHSEDEFAINCVASHKNIMPGESLGSFTFTSNSIPGIVTFYAEGEHPLPSFPEGMAPDSLPGYDDLTPYGPGIVGKTVGPVLPPEPFTATDFLDTLISYKHQSLALGWIKNKGIVTSLDQRLDNARRQIVRGNMTSAKNVLHSFVNEVEAQNEKGLSSEAYALLKYNAEYLISKLKEAK